MKTRGFEPVAEEFQTGLAQITRPTRATGRSAGYDLFAAADALCPPFTITPVPTGVKAYMPDNEFLQVSVRSSLAKNGLMLANGVGIIDADYFGNPSNDGHIYVMIANIKDTDYLIRAGDRIAQGIFLTYGVTDDDTADASRQGGFGSTGR